MVDVKAKTTIDTLKRDAAYPNLGKRASDGAYCYPFQRRISPYITIFCVRKGISANIATGIDLVLALMAAWSLSQGFYLSGVILIQLFGLWSCVDGEIARVTGSASQLGDFYDTMTDRSAEFIIFTGMCYSMPPDTVATSWGGDFLLLHRHGLPHYSFFRKIPFCLSQELSKKRTRRRAQLALCRERHTLPVSLTGDSHLCRYRLCRDHRMADNDPVFLAWNQFCVQDVEDVNAANRIEQNLNLSPYSPTKWKTTLP